MLDDLSINLFSSDDSGNKDSKKMRNEDKCSENKHTNKTKNKQSVSKLKEKGKMLKIPRTDESATV
jgi:hypothetical protein